MSTSSHHDSRALPERGGLACRLASHRILFRWLVSVVFGLAVLAPLFAPAPASASLSVHGMSLSKAYNEDFFRFFEFKMVGIAVTRDGYTTVIFKPDKKTKYRRWVTLFVSLDKDGQIRRMRMELRRGFIDDLRKGMFARDVAKSFIQAAVPASEHDDVRSIVNEIFFRQKLTRIPISGSSSSSGRSRGITIYKLGTGDLAPGDVIIIGNSSYLPKLPQEKSTIYQCFVGELDRAKLDLPKTVIQLDNTTTPNGRMLQMNVISKMDLKRLANIDVDFSKLPLRLP